MGTACPFQVLNLQFKTQLPCFSQISSLQCDINPREQILHPIHFCFLPLVPAPSHGRHVPNHWELQPPSPTWRSFTRWSPRGLVCWWCIWPLCIGWCHLYQLQSCTSGFIFELWVIPGGFYRPRSRFDDPSWAVCFSIVATPCPQRVQRVTQVQVQWSGGVSRQVQVVMTCVAASQGRWAPLYVQSIDNCGIVWGSVMISQWGAGWPEKISVQGNSSLI